MTVGVVVITRKMEMIGLCYVFKELDSNVRLACVHYFSTEFAQ